jgi:prolyl-tRNA synthetase
MHDGYSFHRSYHELNNFFPRLFKAFRRIFERCGIQTFAAEAGVGYIGGEKSFEFLMPAASGDHALIRCGKCQYAASKEVAIGGKDYLRGEMLPLEKVATPGCATIESLGQFLDLPRNRLAKSLLYLTPRGLVLAVVRGFRGGAEKLTYLKVPVWPGGDRELPRRASPPAASYRPARGLRWWWTTRWPVRPTWCSGPTTPGSISGTATSAGTSRAPTWRTSP